MTQSSFTYTLIKDDGHWAVDQNWGSRMRINFTSRRALMLWLEQDGGILITASSWDLLELMLDGAVLPREGYTL